MTSSIELEPLESDGFAGHVSPATCWQVLSADGDAILVDVRTQAEWQYVGLPDLSGLGKQTLCVEWQSYPDLQVNPAFAEQLRPHVGTATAPLFFICRSGVRSMAAARVMTAEGHTPCYNVAGGFEGDTDAHGHRASVNGWKFADLPWRQN
ncbi:MAG: rhodanese-like domain-containing protein [Rhodobiaceae bacterium]|jgi:rhodanese-related sulfurtransferase